MENSPNYIRQLLMPTAKPPQGRRAWSIDLQSVWIPFFTSTNLMGDTAIPYDALGCPLRLAYDKDGAVRFSRTGRPVIRVAKPIAQSITLVRENFVANLQQYAHSVATDRPKEYASLVKLVLAQGEPIAQHDNNELAKAVKFQMEQAVKDAEAKALADEKVEAEAKALAENPVEATGVTPQSKRQAVKV